MRLYARPSWRLVRQLLADAFVLAWVVIWWLISRVVDTSIRMIAQPVQEIAATTKDLSKEVVKAATEAGKIPMLGGDLRRPFDAASTSVDSISAQASQQVQAIELTASVLGWAAFLLPVTFVLVLWLPARIRYIRHTSAAAELLASAEGTDLLALRGLTNLPLTSLRRISSTPVSDWRGGNASVIAALANEELKSLGMRLPKSRTAVEK